ncbi:hypothetical protein BV25DRAFT_1042456 [Artomyces pyxidatus]|uniref:Uncharacterized protein n=1 Tax=Artomyces pyxidatus TaxID=48021 RepID=A0ACB8SV02_9AGAM|nr:hypothetical protein BV25DRAFT_1042456 [Artomyces pyxidatus]
MAVDMCEPTLRHPVVLCSAHNRDVGPVHLPETTSTSLCGSTTREDIPARSVSFRSAQVCHSPGSTRRSGRSSQLAKISGIPACAGKDRIADGDVSCSVPLEQPGDLRSRRMSFRSTTVAVIRDKHDAGPVHVLWAITVTGDSREAHARKLPRTRCPSGTKPVDAMAQGRCESPIAARWQKMCMSQSDEAVWGIQAQCGFYASSVASDYQASVYSNGPQVKSTSFETIQMNCHLLTTGQSRCERLNTPRCAPSPSECRCAPDWRRVSVLRWRSCCISRGCVLEEDRDAPSSPIGRQTSAKTSPNKKTTVGGSAVQCR